MMKKLVYVAMVLLAFPSWGMAQEDDRLLQVLKQELEYSFNELKKQKLPPYYMNLRAVDQYEANLTSSFGAMFSSKAERSRTLVPQIRLGSPELDNFKYTTQTIPNGYGVSLPLEDNAEDAIRQAVWAEVSNRYDAACEIYKQTQVQSAVSVENEDKSPCFSASPAEHYYEAPLPAGLSQIDVEAWGKRLDEISAVFRECPLLQNGNATLMFESKRSYFVNTEGAEVVQNRVAARLMLSASLMATDGMSLSLSEDFFAFNPEDLPCNDTIIAKARDITRRLVALREAPVADPYTGPAVLSGNASGVFFHEIFGHRLEGHRLKKGGETFKKMVGDQVLPAEFQVYSDPTLSRYAGSDLNGYYLYDDEGVKARRVDNVVDGVLKEFLLGRIPLEGFPNSNGHGRSTGATDPVSRQSNLVIETSHPYTDAELRAMLVEEAKRQGKDYGYFFKTVTSGFTFTGEGGSLNSFNVTPLEVYRVYVDGRPDELVRGVDMIGTPLSMFSNIVAAGDCPEVFTGSCGAESGWVPVTTCSPLIFVSQIETQRQNQSRNLPPILPAPEFKDIKAQNVDDAVFAAMRDEMARNREQLALEGGSKPFYFSYTANRFRVVNVMATLGGLMESTCTPWQMKGATQVMVGDYNRTSTTSYRDLGATGDLPCSGDYNLLRRAFWSTSDMMYKYALQEMMQKEVYLKSNPFSAEEANVPDLQKMPAVTRLVERETPYEVDLASLGEMAVELSAIFKDYPEIVNTSVLFNGAEMDIYRLTSDDVQLKLPQGIITFIARGDVRLASGAWASDSYSVSAATPGELPDFATLKAEVKALAERMMAKRDASWQDESYNGPVMLEGKIVASLFADGLLQRGKLVAERHLPGAKAKGISLADKLGKEIMDPRLTVSNLSLKEYNGQRLEGYYPVDADGVEPAEKTVLVEKGVFKKMLNGHVPTQYAPESTGSARFANQPSDLFPKVTASVLQVETSKGVTQEKMKKALLKAGKSQKLEYVYLLRQAEGCKLDLVRVNVKDGAEEVVLTTVSPNLGFDQLSSLGAICSESQVTDCNQNGCEVSVICPSSLIINGVEIQKATPVIGKEQALKYPLQR